MKRSPAHNSTYKKLAVQWLNQVQFSNQTFVQVDSLVLRNRQLLVAAKRCNKFLFTQQTHIPFAIKQADKPPPKKIP
jgi:hypothetical protein